MKKVEIEVENVGTIEVESCRNGLGIFCVTRGREYLVYHLASAKTVATLNGLKKAQVVETVRDWLGPLADWTQSEEDLLMNISQAKQLGWRVRNVKFAVEEFPDILLKAGS